MATPSEQMQRPMSRTYEIPELVNLALSGGIRVPSFQRSFVWDRDDVRKLFDSIWRGFPIGTLLFWRKEAPAGQASFGPITLGVRESAEALWVVDGQQRLTSLLGVLGGRDLTDDERFALWFDLRRRRFVHAGKRSQPRTWLPVGVTMETKTLLPWLREHDADLEPDDLDIADALGGAIRDYKVQAYIVEKENEAQLREVFDRVNGAGHPIGRAEVFHALFASDTEPGSPATVVRALAGLGFGELDPDRIVQSLLALRGGDVARDIHDEFGAGEDVAEWYEMTRLALARSIEFLRRQGVPHLLLVPSTLPLPVLAVFFHLYPEPEPWNERLLARWVWRGWVHGFGKAGQTPALRQAVRAVYPKKGQPESAPGEYQSVRALLRLVEDEDPGPPALDRFRTDTAAGRLGLLALASQEPRGPDGRPLDLAELMARYRVEAIGELVPRSRTNLAARTFWPTDLPQLTGSEPGSILLSHAISPTAAKALRGQDREAFLSVRGAELRRLLERFSKTRVDSGALIRPPLADLVVQDEEPEPDE